MKRACIFVSYWREAALPDYIHYHVEALAALDFDIHFVSNSPLDKASVARLEKSCASVRERENIGFDFAAWRDVIQSIDLTGYDGLLLTNSSIVGPLFDLSPVFAEMQRRKCDFWGLTLNRLYHDHLQSFFLYFQPQVWQSQAWCDFWNNVKDHTDKSKVIFDYELEVYNYFQNAGFAGTSYIKPNALWTILTPSLVPGRRIRPIYYDDPTIIRAAEIIREGFPYVKASLLWGEAMNFGQPYEQLQLFERFHRSIETDYDWSMVAQLVQEAEHKDRSYWGRIKRFFASWNTRRKEAPPLAKPKSK